jgi:flagellar motor switch protein FliG
MDEKGLEDAAILLMSLGEEEAAEVFKHLEPKEVQGLGETIAKLKSVPRDRVEKVLTRFADDSTDLGVLVPDTDEYVKAVLRKALGEEKASLLIDRIIQGSDVKGIESLKWMDAQSVAELLRNEHPQIVAAILVHLDPDQCSSVLRSFSDRHRNEVMVRIATLDGIQPQALKDLNEVLSRVLAGGTQVRKSSLGGVKPAAEIINLMGSSLETSVLDYIRETLIIALKGATPEIREKIFKNMSSRAAETLREDLDSRGPVKLSEVETEQKEMLKIVRRLADEGQITLASGGDDEYV